jgi:hypothetical protein
LFLFVGKLRTILEYDDLKPEVFQGYREIGNIIAFVKDLSELLDVHEQLRFVNVAPLLGLAPDATDAPVYTSTPLGAVLQRLSESLVASIDQVAGSGPGNAAAGAGSSALSNSLHQLQTSPHHRVYNSALAIVQLPELANKMVSSLSAVIHTKSLLSYFMSKMDEAFFQFNLSTEWGFQCTPEGAVDLDSGSAFHRLFSALNFLFCVFETQPDPEPDASGHVEEQDIVVPDDDEFGHGFAMAGIMFMHLLDQRAIFEMSDFSYFVLNVYNHDKRGVSDTSVGDVDSDLVAETTRFVSNAMAQRSVHLELFSYFEMQIPRKRAPQHNNGASNGSNSARERVPGTPSFMAPSTPIVKLHPPADA